MKKVINVDFAFTAKAFNPQDMVYVVDAYHKDEGGWYLVSPGFVDPSEAAVFQARWSHFPGGARTRRVTAEAYVKEATSVGPMNSFAALNRHHFMSEWSSQIHVSA